MWTYNTCMYNTWTCNRCTYNTYRACRIGPRGVVVVPVKPNQALALLHLIHFNHGQSLAFSVSYGWRWSPSWWSWSEIWAVKGRKAKGGKSVREEKTYYFLCKNLSISLEFGLFKISLHISCLDEDGNGGQQDDTGGYTAFCYWLESLFVGCWLFLRRAPPPLLHMTLASYIGFGTQTCLVIMLTSCPLTDTPFWQ